MHLAQHKDSGKGVPDFSGMDLNRDPVVVFWEVTLACALACRHCRAEAMPRRHPLELSTDECRRVLDDLATFDRLPIVVLSGGTLSCDATSSISWSTASARS